jgi:hypothetical protein
MGTLYLKYFLDFCINLSVLLLTEVSGVSGGIARLIAKHPVVPHRTVSSIRGALQVTAAAGCHLVASNEELLSNVATHGHINISQDLFFGGGQHVTFIRDHISL